MKFTSHFFGSLPLNFNVNFFYLRSLVLLNDVLFSKPSESGCWLGMCLATS